MAARSGGALSIGATARARRGELAVAVAAERRQIAERQARAARPAGRRSVHAGASFGRLTADWVTSPLSADQTIRYDLRTLRDRGRSLVRDNALAKRFIRLSVANIIGPKGMRLQPQVKLPDGSALDKATNALIADGWARWCRRRNASASRRLSFAQIERQMVATWKTEGEYLVQLVPGFRNEFGFTLQPLDNDQLDHELNVPASPGQNEIRMGVEVDQWGAPVAYHLWTAHPSEPTRMRTRTRVPADRIIHVYTEDRPNQSRGVTAFAPVLQDIRHFGALQEAVLVLQRIAACKMGFLTVDPDKASWYDSDEDDPTGPVSLEAEPGSIPQLPPGMGFENWDPGQPTAEYTPFTRVTQQLVSAGLDVSYASLSGDLSQTSYASGRMGMLGERDAWETNQSDVIEQFHERVFAEWVKWAILSRALPLDFDPERYAIARFQPRGFAWVDPQKDLEASLREVGAGLNSLTNLCDERGLDLETILRQRKQEQELAASIGVTLQLSAPPRPGTPAGSGADDEASPDGADAPDSTPKKPTDANA